MVHLIEVLRDEELLVEKKKARSQFSYDTLTFTGSQKLTMGHI